MKTSPIYRKRELSPLRRGCMSLGLPVDAKPKTNLAWLLRKAKPWRSKTATAKREKCGSRGKPPGAKNLNRRDHLLRRFGLTAEEVDGTHQITPLLRQMGMLPSQLIEVLRADDSPESRKIVAGWDSLTPANREFLRLEGLVLAVDLTTQRLWELYNGANRVLQPGGGPK
jgi:hypothetical protein